MLHSKHEKTVVKIKDNRKRAVLPINEGTAYDYHLSSIEKNKKRKKKIKVETADSYRKNILSHRDFKKFRWVSLQTAQQEDKRNNNSRNLKSGKQNFQN